jgi:hypothetical protein
LIVLGAIILEEFTLRNSTITHSIVYEDLELLKTAKKQRILKELSALTGKEIIRYKIRDIDYKKKVASMEISYKE